jgi:hypothetical protein
MARPLHPLVRACFVAAALLGVPAAASADGPPTTSRAAARKPLVETLPPAARLEFQAGKILFEDGDFATALQKFRSAYAKQADGRLLYNIAVCEKGLRHYARAIRLFRQYMTEEGPLLTSADRQDTEQLIKLLEEFAVPVKITVSVEGARVSVDDEPVGTSPLAGGVVLDLGQRRLQVEKEGFRTFTKVVPVEPGAALDVQLERQRGRLELGTVAGATVTLDGKPIGTGPTVKVDDLPVGGHQLRIEAPRMKPYQGEVVLEDDKTRTLRIDLELDPERAAEIRVAVGCRSPVVVTPDHGLAVFLDGSEESASPLGTRTRAAGSDESAAYVPFGVSPGTHTVVVRIPTCDPLQTSVEATWQKPGLVSGALPPTNPFFNGSPAGSPNGWRVGAGFAYSRMHLDNFQDYFPSHTIRPTSANLELAGPAVSAGLTWRWFMVAAEARYLLGSSTGTQAGPVGNVLGAVPQAGSFSTWDVAVRSGPRIPLNLASIALGGEAGAGGFTASPDGGSSHTAFVVRAGGWASLDLQPLCDFSVGVGPRVGVFAMTSPPYGSGLRDGLDVGLFAQAAWAPNTLCDRKRNGEFALQGSSAPASGEGKP